MTSITKLSYPNIFYIFAAWFKLIIPSADGEIFKGQNIMNFGEVFPNDVSVISQGTDGTADGLFGGFKMARRFYVQKMRTSFGL
jgi:hypothetical protein